MYFAIPHMVLIDLDGTLVDSVPDLTAAVDAMMRDLGLPERGEARVRHWVGNGVERLVKRALTDSLDGEPDPALYERAYPVFKQHYAACNGTHSVLYPGVTEGLAFLQSHPSVKLGCITNKAEQFTVPLLTKLGVADVFGLIISGDKLPEKKPHPMPLLHAVEFFGTTPGMSLMLGDSITDVRAARAAEFGGVVCVSYGYNHGEDIRTAKPDAVIDSFSELPSLFVPS